MSYLTTYSLEHDVPEEEITELVANLTAFRGRYITDAVVDGSSITVPWYDHESDLLYISREFPDNIFILTGEGEEHPDLWKKRFHNGQVWEIRAEIIWPDFPILP